MMAMLSMLCLAGCETPRPKLAIATPDPAKLAPCPQTFPIAPALSPLQPFTLPDGRQVVLYSTVKDRDLVTAHYIIEGRGAWHDCASPVAYTLDWIQTIKHGEAR